MAPNRDSRLGCFIWWTDGVDVRHLDQAESDEEYLEILRYELRESQKRY